MPIKPAESPNSYYALHSGIITINAIKPALEPQACGIPLHLIHSFATQTVANENYED